MNVILISKLEPKSFAKLRLFLFDLKKKLIENPILALGFNVTMGTLVAVHLLVT
jgi:hypothetical protein